MRGLATGDDGATPHEPTSQSHLAPSPSSGCTCGPGHCGRDAQLIQGLAPRGWATKGRKITCTCRGICDSNMIWPAKRPLKHTGIDDVRHCFEQPALLKRVPDGATLPAEGHHDGTVAHCKLPCFRPHGAFANDPCLRRHNAQQHLELDISQGIWSSPKFPYQLCFKG